MENLTGVISKKEWVEEESDILSIGNSFEKFCCNKANK